MAERQRPDRERGGRHAAEAVDRLGIVVAGDPDPVAAALQRAERRAVLAPTVRAVAVVEAVAQRKHRARRIAR